MSMIPTKTGAAAAVGLVLPELNGKLDGYAIRVPTINVSLVDLSFVAKRDTTADEVNAIMKEAAASPGMKGILAYNTAPLVSRVSQTARAASMASRENRISMVGSCQ